MVRFNRPRPALPSALRGPLAVMALVVMAAPACAQTDGSEAGIGAEAPLLDSARAELAVGRPWHVSRMLGPRASSLGPEGRLLLARAEAGWGDWEAVRALLEGAGWLDAVDGAGGWRLLGRALEEEGSWSSAADAYGTWLAGSGGTDSLAAAVRTRQARALWNAGRELQALETLAAVAQEMPALASWEAVALAAAPSREGRPEPVRTLLARVSDPVALAGGWDLLPRALLAAGDSAAARDAFARAASDLSGGRRAEALDRVGALALAAGDTAGARSASLDALAAGPRTRAGGRAAGRLLTLGGLSAGTAAEVGEALDRIDEDRRAVEAYDLHVRLRGGVEALAADVRLDRARLLAVTPGREDEAVTELRALSTHDDDRIGAVALEAWAGLRRRQGRSSDVDTLRGWLLERYPATPEAASVVFFRGDAAHDRVDHEEALRQYEALVAMAPAQDVAGLARMRAGQIHLLKERPREAVDVFEGYLRDFPNGRRWTEAAYWAAHGRLLLGDTAAAREHVAHIRRDDPFSYYAIQGAELLGETFTLDLPPGDEPAPLAAWLRDGLRRLDLLDAAGLRAGAAAEVDRLSDRSRGDHGAMLRLAEELVARGHTIPGINLVWALRADGEPWTLRLARAAYPFPFREAVLREAEERGADPWWLVAIIRQESAFDPDIRSSAGAVGLMQVMPETGRQVARAVGPSDFRAEALEEPDVNLHLGTHYFVENLERFDGIVPLVLSAYNAGPQRADEWRRFPEAVDWLRFVERIPYGETRDYVKQVTRNRALYQVLWSDVPRERGVS